MAGEFFTTCLCVVFDDMDDEVTVDIRIDATDEYIESKIKEIKNCIIKKQFIVTQSGIAPMIISSWTKMTARVAKKVLKQY